MQEHVLLLFMFPEYDSEYSMAYTRDQLTVAKQDATNFQRDVSWRTLRQGSLRLRGRKRGVFILMDQPSICEVNQSRKQCWGCDEYIPYEFGFCQSCWGLLSEAEQALLGYSAFLAPTLGGSIRSALAQRVKDIRRPQTAPAYVPRQKPLKKVLPDIDLSLEDLEL